MTLSKTHLATVAAVSLLGATVFALPAVSPQKANPVASAPIAGDYVEARTASVFAGACHYNGEYMSLGRDAVMAWNFTAGTYNGVNLAGVRVLAVLTSSDNLAEAAPHKSELTIDPAASSDQRTAVVALLKSRVGDQLGDIQTVHLAPVTFSHTTDGYEVNAPRFATLSVKPMPDDACCTAPANVWYTPLSPIANRKVGYTESATYTGAISYPWYRNGENSAFYGAIAF